MSPAMMNDSIPLTTPFPSVSPQRAWTWRQLAVHLVPVLWIASLAHTTLPAAELNPTRLRRPIRLAASGDAIWVANRDSGTISQVSNALDCVVAEAPIAKRLSDLIALPQSGWLAATDDGAHELLLIRVDPDSNELRVVARQSVPEGPTSVVHLGSSTGLAVSSRWASRVSFWNWDLKRPEAGFRALGHLDLPFAPGLQCLANDGQHLLVADAFGPFLAVLQLEPARLRAVVQIPGHNLRGLALSADGQHLLVAHQMLNDFVPTIRNHVFWGNVLSNMLRTIPLASLLQDRGTGARPRSRFMEPCCLWVAKDARPATRNKSPSRPKAMS